MKKLYALNLEYGRQGSIDGLFIADSRDVNMLMGYEIHLGEALGKHSDVVFELEDKDLTVKSEDPVFIKQLEDLLGADLSGYNPLHYVYDACPTCEEYMEGLDDWKAHRCEGAL